MTQELAITMTIIQQLHPDISLPAVTMTVNLPAVIMSVLYHQTLPIDHIVMTPRWSPGHRQRSRTWPHSAGLWNQHFSYPESVISFFFSAEQMLTQSQNNVIIKLTLTICWYSTENDVIAHANFKYVNSFQNDVIIAKFY